MGIARYREVGFLSLDSVDTSVLVRYLVQDDAEMGAAAKRLIDGERTLGISPVALAETAFVLSSVYKVPREEVVDGLVALLRRRNIETLGVDKNIVASNLMACRSSGWVSYADALINAEARANSVGNFYTFDEKFPSEGSKSPASASRVVRLASGDARR